MHYPARLLLDFAENYHYIVQDEIQGYHWNKDQCTLHPVVIYYREGNEVKHISLCILSDDLEHDFFCTRITEEGYAVR